jgi:hypothetical protein
LVPEDAARRMRRGRSKPANLNWSLARSSCRCKYNQVNATPTRDAAAFDRAKWRTLAGRLRAGDVLRPLVKEMQDVASGVGLNEVIFAGGSFAKLTEDFAMA